MAKRARKSPAPASLANPKGYDDVLSGISDLLKSARRASARAVNAYMTLTYWEIGRRIVEFEQAGEIRAEYGIELLKRLSVDLTARFGRGFSRQNIQNMRRFYEGWPICQTPSGELVSPSELMGRAGKWQTPSAKSVPLPSTPEYRTTLPNEETIADEIQEARKRIESRKEK